MEYEEHLTQSHMASVQVGRWLLEFGRDWVPKANLYQTWVDRELKWISVVHKGYLLERTDEQGLPDALKITDMALKLIGD